MNGMKKDIPANPGAGNGSQSDLSGITKSEPSKKSSDEQAKTVAKFIADLSLIVTAQTEILAILSDKMMNMETRLNALEAKIGEYKDNLKGYQ